MLLVDILALGFYAGSATLYPYGPVFCDSDKGWPCYGVYLYIPKSAPLPSTEKLCKWADIGSVRSTLGLDWYEWKPRQVPLEQQKYLGKYVCYLEDKGEPINLNDMQRND